MNLLLSANEFAASTLKNPIPGADPKKYRSILDARD